MTCIVMGVRGSSGESSQALSADLIRQSLLGGGTACRRKGAAAVREQNSAQNSASIHFQTYLSQKYAQNLLYEYDTPFYCSRKE